jgi:hypothetical protein
MAADMETLDHQIPSSRRAVKLCGRRDAAPNRRDARLAADCCQCAFCSSAAWSLLVMTAKGYPAKITELIMDTEDQSDDDLLDWRRHARRGTPPDEPGAI